VDVPRAATRAARAQAEDGEKCLEEVFKFIAPLAQQLGVVYWLLGKARAIKTTKITPEGKSSIAINNHRGLRLFFIRPYSQHKHKQY
jgi:hypothetical protein